jgi:hypothetical protein
MSVSSGVTCNFLLVFCRSGQDIDSTLKCYDNVVGCLIPMEAPGICLKQDLRRQMIYDHFYCDMFLSRVYLGSFGTSLSSVTPPSS